MSKIIARELTVDMYKCRPELMTSVPESPEKLKELFEENNFKVVAVTVHPQCENCETATVIFSGGHCIVHKFCELNYVAVDLFLCEPEAAPEKLFSALRKMFDPDKVKTTLIKRGDFGTVSDMKPRIKTRFSTFGPFNRAGAKVIKFLTHRPSLHEKF